jgi:hypothetical protein
MIWMHRVKTICDESAMNAAQLLHPLFHSSIFANSSFLCESTRTLRGDIATRVSQNGFSGSSDDRRQRLRRFSAAPREPSSSRRLCSSRRCPYHN